MVGTLVAHGVESYRVDYRQRSTTHFLPTGEWHTVAVETPDIPIVEAFDRQAIVDAIRGS